jgi:hypothetical protein
MTDEIQKTQGPRLLHNSPSEYWETSDARQGGLIGHIRENGLCIHSPVSMHIGAELSIRIFFSLGYEFDEFQVLARIIRKDLCCEGGWEVYEYELEIMRISEEDHVKLKDLLK